MHLRRLATTLGIAAVLLTGLTFAELKEPAQASGYYRIETRLAYDGNNLCLQGNGPGAVVTVARCRNISSQKWAYTNVNGYSVLYNIGHTPVDALTAPSSLGYAVRLKDVVPNNRQSWGWDSLWNRNGNIYTRAYNQNVLEPDKVVPGSYVRWKKWTGVTGKQSWRMIPWGY